MAQLVDHLGRPIEPGQLTREHAAPSLTGVRTVWDDSVASGLTPYRLAALLRNAAAGDAQDYLTLAEEMEERDLHYACELGKRKLAVSRLPVTVEAFSDAAGDKKLADEIRALVRRPGFRSLLKDLLDGLGKGYSAVEILWDRSGATWWPGRYEHRDPRFFQFDRVSRRELRLRDEADLMEGLPLAPYKFIVHVPHLKSGLPIRGGLARLAAWAWMCKNYSVKDWMAFAEVFGMPLRIGKYRSGATDADIAVLKMAVANLGSDAAAVIPESMMVELVERKSTGGGQTVFQLLADWLDAQVSRGILGQTATTQGTPGKLGNEGAQAQVRDDIRDDDAEQLAETINRDLIKPFIDLNFGPQENYPLLVLRAVDTEDVAAISESLAKLVPLGLKVEQSVVRDRLGWPDPDPKARPEDLLGGEPAAPTTGANRTAMNRAGAGVEYTPEQQSLEGLADVSIARVDLGGNEARMLAAIQGATSYEDAMERLLASWPDLTTDDMAATLEAAMLNAGLFGEYRVGKEAGNA
ncbi:MAG: DUF935 domain-containing protein [Thermodesulfobacteriota bacterium]